MGDGISVKRHRFPPDVIRYAIWLYLRFTLSFRDVEEMLAERGIDVSRETVRYWVIKFGPRCCQTDSNSSQFALNHGNLGGTKQPPLFKCGGSEKLEVASGVEVAFSVEEVVDGGVDGDEHL